MITEEEAIKRFHRARQNFEHDLWPKDVPPVLIIVDGKHYYGTREEAIELGVIRNPGKPLTFHERITNKIQDWHSRMAVWHERRSIGLK